MKFKSKQTVLFTGDSITDCDRVRPLGFMHGWLGNGYVGMVDALLHARYPEAPVRVLNTGIGGNRVINLAERWDDDVLAHEPDWVSVMIGINDVWRQFDKDLDLKHQVLIDEFENTLNNLVIRTLPVVEGMVLMTPYFLETNRQDPMRAMMDEYCAAVRNVAEANGTVFVDIQAAFDTYLAHRPTQSLCGDRVHPNTVGHMIITRAFLKAVEFEW
jgi:lysophospholipase L1-like esterase